MTMGNGGAYAKTRRKKYTLRVQLRPILLELTMYWRKWPVPNTSWNIRDTISMTMLFIKIIRLPSIWIWMVDYQVARRLVTSILDIISSLIWSKSRKHLLDYVPFWKWSGIFSRKHYRDLNFIVFVLLSLVFMRMTLLPIMHPEDQWLKITR